MSDTMTAPNFERLLMDLMKEYREHQTFLGVRVSRKKGFRSPVGPAAGPHTQLAGNCVAAFGAGADHFEFKTVQVMEGEALGIQKPCIVSGNEVYNTEWSTELTVEGALEEYIKAYILNYVLGIEFDLAKPDQLHYIMSVGYDLKGIQSKKVDGFIEAMKDPTSNPVWQQAIDVLTSHRDIFDRFDEKSLLTMEKKVSDTVALSTMHGCDRDEIEAIATYLIREKGLNTYVKMNPTLLGEEKTLAILKSIGHEDMIISPEVFRTDLAMDQAIPMLTRLIEVGEKAARTFGVKLTNTLPVQNHDSGLTGNTVYLSGKILYPLTIHVAFAVAQTFHGRLPISYSGGAEAGNIADLVEAGLMPITVSSVLLGPGGYHQLSRMNDALGCIKKPGTVQTDLLKMLAERSLDKERYGFKDRKQFPKAEGYESLCAACKSCVDVCPNRANKRLIIDGKPVVIHYDALCNECGNCSGYCIKGHVPYKEKWTCFQDRQAFEVSTNPGCYLEGTVCNHRFNDSMAPSERKRIKETEWRNLCQ